MLKLEVIRLAGVVEEGLVTSASFFPKDLRGGGREGGGSKASHRVLGLTWFTAAHPAVRIPQ